MKKNKFDFKSIFHNLKFGLFGLSSLLVLFVGFSVFSESCGGNFPDRTRGPLAHKEFYELGMLPDWEDIIMEKFPVDGEVENRIEMLMEDQPYPPLEFGKPSPTPAVSEVREATE